MASTQCYHWCFTPKDLSYSYSKERTTDKYKNKCNEAMTTIFYPSHHCLLTLYKFNVKTSSPSYCALNHSVVPGTKLKICPAYHSSSFTYLCLVNLPTRLRCADESVLAERGCQLCQVINKFSH